MEKRYTFADDIYLYIIWLGILRDLCVRVDFESYGIQLLSNALLPGKPNGNT